MPNGEGGNGENGLNKIISVSAGTGATKGEVTLIQCVATDQFPKGPEQGSHSS